VWRGAVLWALVRVSFWAMMLIPPGAGIPPTITITVSPIAVALIIAATGVLAHVDARMMREPLFHALLGIPRWLPGATATATAVIMEITLELLL
jgi:hypothetical protein